MRRYLLDSAVLSTLTTAGYFGVAMDTFSGASDMAWDWICFS